MTTRSETAYISAGANLGDRRRNLEQGVASLREAGVLLKKQSCSFETEPVGFREQPWFLNMANEIETVLPAEGLLDLCQAIELAMGRTRTFPGAPRLLDLDILFYGNCIIETVRLVIPHPRVAERSLYKKLGRAYELGRQMEKYLAIEIERGQLSLD